MIEPHERRHARRAAAPLKTSRCAAVAVASAAARADEHDERDGECGDDDRRCIARQRQHADAGDGDDRNAVLRCSRGRRDPRPRAHENADACDSSSAATNAACKSPRALPLPVRSIAPPKRRAWSGFGDVAALTSENGGHIVPEPSAACRSHSHAASNAAMPASNGTRAFHRGVIVEARGEVSLICA